VELAEGERNADRLLHETLSFSPSGCMP
jgi:hypothetical protein